MYCMFHHKQLHDCEILKVECIVQHTSQRSACEQPVLLLFCDWKSEFSHLLFIFINIINIYVKFEKCNHNIVANVLYLYAYNPSQTESWHVVAARS